MTRSGRFAAQLPLSDQRSGSITIQRTGSGSNGKPYISEYGCVELTAVAGKTRRMPAEFISGHLIRPGLTARFCSTELARPDFHLLFGSHNSTRLPSGSVIQANRP